MILDCEHALPNLSTHMHTHTHFHKKHHLKEALFAHKVIFVLLTANTYRMPTLCYRQHSQEPYRLYYRRGQRVKFQSTTGKIYNDVFLSPDFFFSPSPDLSDSALLLGFQALPHALHINPQGRASTSLTCSSQSCLIRS